jgi:Skp family chaperone for outer membrane proteins
MKLFKLINFLVVLAFITPSLAFANIKKRIEIIQVTNPIKDSANAIDSLKTVDEIRNHYYFNSSNARSSYVHIKERLDILKYIKSLSWSEKQQVEIFKLYINTNYHSEPHEADLKKDFEAGKLSETLQQNRQKLQQRLTEIAGKEGCKQFWKHIELITDKYTDHSKY